MNRASPALHAHLARQVAELGAQVSSLKNHQLRKENELLKRESMSGRGMGDSGGYSSNGAAIDAIRRNMPAMNNLPFYLAPGNLGDVNTVLWPFFFPTAVVEVAPNQQVTTNFSVTQEAAFVAIGFMKVIFLRNDVPTTVFRYINPDDPAGGGLASGLSVTIQDNTSTRLFTDKSVLTDTIGHPRFPTLLDAPLMILPRSNISVNFISSNPTDVFEASLIFYGYRVRIENADQIRALATGQGVPA